MIDLPQVRIVATTGSTNDDARELARAGAPQGTAVAARAQSGGRGRRGHAWASPEGGLYLSVVLRPGVGPQHFVGLPAVCALGALRAVREATRLGARVGIKWPNDLVIDNRKLAGLLVEAGAGEGGPFAVLGIGINLARPGEAPRATGPAASEGASGGTAVDAGSVALGEAAGDAGADTVVAPAAGGACVGMPTRPGALGAAGSADLDMPGVGAPDVDPAALGVSDVGTPCPQATPASPCALAPAYLSDELPAGELPSFEKLAELVRDRVVEACDAWAADVRAGRAKAGPLAPILSEYFDCVPMLGHQAMALSPEGAEICRGAFVAVDVWGRVTIHTATGHDVVLAAEQASLRPLE